MQNHIPKTIEFAIEYQSRYWEIRLEHNAVSVPDQLQVSFSPVGYPELKGFMKIESRIQDDNSYRWSQRLTSNNEVALQREFLEKIGNAIEKKIFDRAPSSTTTYINRSVDQNYSPIHDRLSIPFYKTVNY